MSSISATCGAWLNVVFPAWFSTTSTAEPKARSRCVRTAGVRTRDISPAPVRRRSALRSPHARARHPNRSSIPARAGGQQPHVFPARGRSCRTAGGRSRHHLRALDALGMSARGCQGGNKWAGVVSAVSGRGHDAARAGIARARAAGYSALVVTVDTPVAGLRERDVRNGMRELITGGVARLPFLSGSSWPDRAG